MSVFKLNKVYILIFISILIVCISSFVALSLFKSYSDNNYNIFEISSFYANYDVTVISNKNKNMYVMEEWYKKDDTEEKFKFSFLDFLGGRVDINIVNDSISISNESELNKLIFENIYKEKTNLYSITTYIDIINNHNKDLFDITDNLNDDGSTTYSINFKGENEYSFLSKGINLSKVEINILDNTPNYINIYSKEDICINIEYRDFEIEYFEDGMFV